MREGWVEAIALLAPVLTAVGVAGFASRSALRLAREERSAGAKREAYLMLAEHVVRIRQLAMVLNPELDDDHPLMPPSLSDEDRYRMFAHVEVFGSPAVREAMDKVLRGTVSARTWVSELAAAKAMSPPYTDDIKEYRSEALRSSIESKTTLLASCDEALRLLNEELTADRRRAASRTRFGRSTRR